MADFAGFLLLALLTLAAVRGCWRRAQLRVVFARRGDRAGRVALVWFRASLFHFGGVWRWLWLPRSISARLWRLRASGSGLLARWLRRFPLDE